MEPISSSRPRARAGVDGRHLERFLGADDAAPLATFASSAAVRISVKRSRRLLLAAPSVPTPTPIAARRIAATARDAARELHVGEGQCATLHAFAREEVELVLFEVHRDGRR
jgi:hypothetical protein